MTKIFTFLTGILFTINLSAQTIVDTVNLSSGKTIIVFNNGTWKEIKAEKPLNGGTFADTRDGKVYKTITIGTQTWMAENLAYKADKGCWAYNNDTSNVAIYGYLYNWETAKKACPAGWHLPNDSEWTTLTDYLGGEAIAGNKLRSKTGWNLVNTPSTNSSGFTALPGGFSDCLEGPFSIGEYGGWWSTAEFDLNNVWNRSIKEGSDHIDKLFVSKNHGFSVRCIKDQ